jgi:hypothetical protein
LTARRELSPLLLHWRLHAAICTLVLERGGNMATVTQAQLSAGLNTIKAIADAIKELREVPSGHLYARIMSTLDYPSYEKIIGILTRAGLISVSPGHLITWIAD